MELYCFKCDKTLESVFPDAKFQPYAGTCFSSQGHYGSTVWDPMDDSLSLELIICDDCLKLNAKRVKMLKVRGSLDYEYNDWEIVQGK